MNSYLYLIDEETAAPREPYVLFYDPRRHQWYEDVWHGDPDAARAVGQRMTKFGIRVVKFDPRVARAWAEKHGRA